MAKLKRGKEGGWKENFWIGIIVVVVTGLLVSGLYGYYTENKEIDIKKSQIDSSLQKADSRLDSGQYEEAINLYEEIINTISSKEFPYRYAWAQNNMGNAYYNLALAYVFSWPGLISVSVEHRVPVASMSPGRS
jgi:tetratricopeptide (TPR) repeat protein